MVTIKSSMYGNIQTQLIFLNSIWLYCNLHSGLHILFLAFFPYHIKSTIQIRLVSHVIK